ncbi:GyrI-like domain-containing protein [Carboxydothermus pertinax]|uniref:AraC family transcriptional regulator n=1 Tax=Carboxydothermus pertinax TaxID=870242 RepID=A0A1L8CVG4_9THEO|nr:effector binding domain-containing protein [Carboxydothermus pertinax]GAV22900.1 AraC family transcriptional regulator [Carboxydothermus pertinax]
MIPEIVFKPGFYLVGIKYEGRNENEEISELWKKFNLRISEIKSKVSNNERFGLNIYGEKFLATGEFTYLAAVAVEKIEEVPEGMAVAALDPAKYAVFTLPGQREKLPKLIHDIYCRHLKKHGLKPVGNYDFEFYTGKDLIYFYVPIEYGKRG